MTGALLSIAMVGILLPACVGGSRCDSAAADIQRPSADCPAEVREVPNLAGLSVAEACKRLEALGHHGQVSDWRQGKKADPHVLDFYPKQVDVAATDLVITLDVVAQNVEALSPKPCMPAPDGLLPDL